MTRLLATAILTCCALAATAHARPKVAITPIDDDNVQDAVSDALDGDQLSLVSPEQFSRAADKLDVDPSDLSEGDVKALARDLGADAVLVATLSEKDGYQVLHFKIYVHGKKQRGFRIQFGSPRSPKFKHALHDKLVEKLGAADVARDGDDDHARHDDDGADADDHPKDRDHQDADSRDDDGKDADADADADAGDGDRKDADRRDGDRDHGDRDHGDRHDDGRGDDDRRDDDHGRKGHDRTARADGDDDDDEVHAHGDVATPVAGGRAANRVAVRVDLGPSVTARQLTFNSNLPANERPAGYHNSPVPGVRVAGEIFPFAFGHSDGWLAGLGLAGMYDKTISLGLKSPAQPGMTFAADQHRYELGPRYRIVFGHAATSASLTIGADYGHRTFKIDSHNLPTNMRVDVPDVDYRGFTPSLELRVPFVPSIALVAGGGTLLATSAGAIQSASQYGRAKVTEAEAHLGLDILIGKRFAIGLTGEFAQVGFEFTGTGTLSNNRDMNPATKDVGGAADQYFGGAATFAVLY